MYTVLGAFKTRTQRVIWALEELGLNYEWINAPPQSEQARAINPSGKVPALMVDGDLLADSEAILSYLCDKHKGIGFCAGTIDRARQDAHLAFAAEQIDGPLWVQLRTKRLTGEEPFALSEAVRIWLQDAFEKLQNAIGDGPYLMGEAFTIADIFTAQCLGWAKGEGHMLPKPVLEYYRRCYARPAAVLMRQKYL